MLAVKHLDPVVGIDVHLVSIPPAVVPIPHPHVGFVMDFKDLSESAKGYLSSIAMSVVAEKASEVLANNPALAEKVSATMGAVGSAVSSVTNNPVVSTAMKLGSLGLDAKKQLSGSGQGGSSNRPIMINGMLRTTLGTGTKHIPGLHFPLGAGFVGMPSQDSQSFMGSKTVIANSDYMSYMALPALSCWSFGMPPPAPSAGQHTVRRHLSLPTSFMLPIPSGRPVLVGGPPTLNFAALFLPRLFKAIKNFRGSAAAKTLAKKLKLKSGIIKCVILKAEPVHGITGEVIIEQNDFTIAGRFPLEWDRYYAGHRQDKGVLGQGWRTQLDTQLVLMLHDGAIGAHFKRVDGDTAFDVIPLEEGELGQTKDWQGQYRLRREGLELQVIGHTGIIWRFRLSENWVEALSALTEDKTVTLGLSQIEDRDGNGWQCVRDEDERIIELREFTHQGLSGRYVSCHYGYWEKRREKEVYPYQGEIDKHLYSLVLHDGEEVHPLMDYWFNYRCLLTQVIDSEGNPYRFRYDEYNGLVEHCDRNGLSFYYAYDDFADGKRRVIHAWGDGGLYDYHFSYDLGGQETQFTDSLGNKNVLQYDESGYPICEINGSEERTTWQYDNHGRVISEIDGMGRQTQWSYDEDSNLIKETLSDHSEVKMTYDDNWHLCCFTDALGGNWSQSWDERGHLVSQQSPSGVKQSYEYDDYGQIKLVTGADGVEVNAFYDHLGFLSCLGSESQGYRVYHYDRQGRLIYQREVNGAESRYRYDSKGRLIEANLPMQRIECSYDGEDNVLSNKVYTEDGKVQETRFGYMGQGELQRLQTADGRVVEYAYDTECQLIGVLNQLGQRWELGRDAAGRLVRERDYWGRERKYSYDASGYLTGSVDPLGQMLNVVCDRQGRIVEKRVLVEGEETEGSAVWYRYNALGQLEGAGDKHSELARRYGRDGELEWERVSGYGAVRVIGYEYDGCGREIAQLRELRHEAQEGLSFKEKVSYGYDDLGYLAELKVNEGEPIRLSYNPNGELVQRKSGQLSFDYRYTLLGQLSHQKVSHRESKCSEVEYYYDGHGNLLHKRDSREGDWHYKYDAIGQIISEIDPYSRLLKQINDACGNRFIEEFTENGSEVRHDNGVTYKRDLSGKTVYREVPFEDKQHLSWDEWGNLHSVRGNSSRGEYGYDVLGRRIYKRVESREGNKKQEYWYGWDGDRFITELYREEEREHYGHTTHIKGEIKGYGYHYSGGSYEALGQSVYLDGKNGLYYRSYGHYETDLNGMPLRLYGEDGELIWTARYSLWGEADTRYALLCRNHHQPLRYQGQYFDEETGLHYNRYRYYDAKCGVFISQDPIGLLGGLNPYQYAPNSIGWADPWGLSWGDVLIKAGIPKPEGMQRAHGHHIVFKGDFSGDARKPFIDRSKAILNKYKIDVVHDINNLMWAPNIAGVHTTKNAEKVALGLEVADRDIQKKIKSGEISQKCAKGKMQKMLQAVGNKVFGHYK